ncbi:choice-of-anchor D domain-containing protein [Anaeromyxobacter terrae]|uniref:choice-of-anchor D domain-containing protein n=1 Tax=Anaeromyxobacter terrae TaxID=2925406 RepID=UPI001F57B353|nr:choice-of-anchor D domain-containing protein [Anaeromyxobacter sp. SG22]
MYRVPHGSAAVLSIAGLVALFACGGGASSPSLVASPSDVAFGDVSLGGSTSRTITLTNTSGKPLTITDVNSTGSALVTSGAALPLTLTPGESTRLAVELVPAASGNVAGAVTVTSSDPVNPTIVNHLGKGVLPSSSVTAAPAAIAFGQVAVGDRAVQNVTLTNLSGRDVTITNMVATGSGVAASVPALPFTIRSGASASVAVAFAPTVVGAVTGDIALRSDQPHPEAVIELSGSGVVSAPPVSVIANPTTLPFGDVTVGSFSARTVTLTNLSAEPVAISAVDATGAGFSASGLSLPATLSPGTSATLTVRFTPTAAGATSGTLSVRSPSSADPLAVVDFSANGVPFAGITSVTVRDATVMANGTVQMAADVAATGTIDKSVTWSLDSGSPGSIDATTGIYTAPATPGSYRVLATSKADPSKAGYGTVTVSAPAQSVSISVSPTTASLVGGATQAFTATVTGTTNAAVTWSIQEGAAGGSITASGVYTAPATAGTYHVVATSGADRSKTATATVTVTAPIPLPPSSPSPSPSPSGPQFYVATTGNDANPGTEAQPWRTIQKAMNSATAGSTVNIKGGTYPERLTVNVSGTAGSYITFQPYGYAGSGTGDSVVLDYSSFGLVTDGVPFLAVSNRSYVRIQGLTFQNYQVRGAMQRGVNISGSSSYVEFKSNKVLNIQNNGAWDGTNALLDFWVTAPANHVWIYGNEFGHIVSNYGETLSVTGSYVTIENNWIHDTDAIAIDLGQNSSNNIVRGNTLEWISKRRDGSYWYTGSGANAIYVTGGNTATIERNTVRDSGWAYGVVSEPGYPMSHDVVIRNNVAERNYAGIMLGNWYSTTDGSSVYNIQVLNNTLYSCANGLVIRPYTSATVVWKNNIVANSSASVVNGLGWPVGTMDYNLYVGGGTGPDVHKVTADPQFTNAGAGDFSLRSTSPAINSGDASVWSSVSGAVDFVGNPRVMNGGVEIGAYEVQ